MTDKMRAFITSGHCSPNVFDLLNSSTFTEAFSATLKELGQVGKRTSHLLAGSYSFLTPTLGGDRIDTQRLALAPDAELCSFRGIGPKSVEAIDRAFLAALSEMGYPVPDER